jgi:hypothetical protein
VFPWAEYFFLSTSDDACIVVVEVCAVAAQPGHMKELQLVQLGRGLRIIDLPDVIFEDNDSIQGQNESSVLLRNVVKPGDALSHDRFVRLKEVGQCWGRARCQVRTLMWTRRAEWEGRSCVAEVFEPNLGVLAWHQDCQYVTIIQPNIDDLQMKRRKNRAYAPILLSTKTRRFAPRFAPAYHFPLQYQSATAPAGSRASSTTRMTSASSTTLCSMRM